MMYKTVASKVSIDPVKFFDGMLTRSVGGKAKLRVSIVQSQIGPFFVTNCFLNYRTLKELNLLLGKYGDSERLSVQARRKFVIKRWISNSGARNVPCDLLLTLLALKWSSVFFRWFITLCMLDRCSCLCFE